MIEAALLDEPPAERIRASACDGQAGAPLPSALHGAAHLLDGILARSPSGVTATVLLLPCHGSAWPLGERLATASAMLLGRTLLVDARTDFEFWPDTAQAAAEPDRIVPALMHMRLAAGSSGRGHTGQPIGTGLEAISRACRLVVIVCAEAGVSARALTLAPLCTGVVLLVRAGETKLREIEDACRTVVSVHGQVLGTVLMEAPDKLPPWLR